MNELSKQVARKKARKAVAGGQPKLFGLLRNWAHQGFFYLDRTERIARILMEVIPFLFVVFGVALFTDISPTSFWLWISSLLLVHTLNWIFNANFWACVLFAIPWLRNPGAETTCRYLNMLAARLERDESIIGAMVYGSLSRGKWHSRSDLDVRLLRHSGFFNGIRAACIMIRERCIALFARQPLDAYLADGFTFLEKMRQDELPIFLVKRSEELEKRYSGISVRELQVTDLSRQEESRESS